MCDPVACTWPLSLLCHSAGVLLRDETDRHSAQGALLTGSMTQAASTGASKLFCCAACRGILCMPCPMVLGVPLLQHVAFIWARHPNPMLISSLPVMTAGALLLFFETL